MQLPLDKGMPYKVIKWELVEACPKLMAFLSRTGNLNHGVHRVATALQRCMAVFHAYQQGEGDWPKAIKVASQGQPPDFQDQVANYKSFVEAHAGGADGRYLTALEQYERSLGVKRIINPIDLQRLASVSMPEAPRYVPAMVKALLNAPSSKVTANGTADLFSAADIQSVSPAGKNRKPAIQAGDLMSSASTFLAAYCQLDETVIAKYQADMEVRCVMHVHQIKVSTRTSFPSLLHIAEAMWNEVKKADVLLPEWPKIKALPNASGKLPSKAPHKIIEHREDGKVPNGELLALGLAVGADVVPKEGGDTYKIMSMDNELTVSLKLSDPQSKKGELAIARIALMRDWQLYTPPTEESYIPGQYQSPDRNVELKASIYKGFVKAAMVSVFKTSSENHVKIVRKPELKVVALNDFNIGRLVLVGLTQNVTIQVLSQPLKPGLQP